MTYCKYCGLSKCCCPSAEELKQMVKVLEGLEEGCVIVTQSMGRPCALMPVGQHADHPGRVARDAGLRRPAERTRAAQTKRG